MRGASGWEALAPRLITALSCFKMIEEHSSVILCEDLSEDGLYKGDVGVVVHIHKDGEAYEVEFVTMDGSTVAVRTLKAAQVQSVDAKMIPHVREMAV